MSIAHCETKAYDICGYRCLVDVKNSGDETTIESADLGLDETYVEIGGIRLAIARYLGLSASDIKDSTADHNQQNGEEVIFEDGDSGQAAIDA